MAEPEKAGETEGNIEEEIRDTVYPIAVGANFVPLRVKTGKGAAEVERPGIEAKVHYGGERKPEKETRGRVGWRSALGGPNQRPSISQWDSLGTRGKDSWVVFLEISQTAPMRDMR